MSATAAIAWNTFLEAVREKVLYLLAGFAAFVFVASRLLAPLALGEGGRITTDLGLTALSVFGLMIVIFVGHSLVYRELERGSVVFVFSRPVARGSFVAGKFLGLALVLTLAEASMGLILALVLAASRYPCGAALVSGILATLLGSWILAAVAILLATLASPVTAGLFVLGAWVIGSTAGSLADLASMLGGGAVATIARALLLVVPRLDLFHAAAAPAVAGIAPERWAFLASYAVLYALASLLLARAAFERRPLLGG